MTFYMSRTSMKDNLFTHYSPIFIFFARLQGFWEERTVAPGKIDAFLPSYTYLHYNLDPTFSPLVMQRVICKAWRSHVGYLGPHK